MQSASSSSSLHFKPFENGYSIEYHNSNGKVLARLCKDGTELGEYIFKELSTDQWRTSDWTHETLPQSEKLEINAFLSSRGVPNRLLNTAVGVTAAATEGTDVFLSATAEAADSNSASSSVSVLPENSRFDQHYQRVQDFAMKREWTEESLNLAIPERRRACIERMSKRTEHQKITGTPFKATIESIEGDYANVRILNKKDYKDPRVFAWIVIALNMLTEFQDSEAASVLLNQLHHLDVEKYLTRMANSFETRKNFILAEHYYHALTLMHPFDVLFYMKRTTLLSVGGHYEQCAEVCRKGLQNITDEFSRQSLESKLVLCVMMGSKPLLMNRAETMRFMDTALKIKDRFEIEDSLPASFIKTLSNILKEYTRHFGYHNDESLKTLFGYMKDLLKLTDDVDPDIQEIRQYWAEQLTDLIYSNSMDEDDAHSKRNYLREMALKFGQYPKVMRIFFVWCFQNDCFRDIINVYERRPRNATACLECYYLAKAIDSMRKRVFIDEIGEHFRRSYESARLPWTAFNLGSFHLSIRRSPTDALPFLQDAVKLEGENPRANHLKQLWACQLLCGLQNNAEETLNLLTAISPSEVGVFYTLQRAGSFTFDEVFACAEITEFKQKTFDYPKVEIRSFAKIVIPKHIESWIDNRKINLGDGYFGVPTFQRNAHRLENSSKQTYFEEIQTKVDRREVLSRLPLARQDCWIGRAGKNNIPRVDIELYASKGEAPHFQRFRFQCGQKTYGGLWLPIGQTLTIEKIQQAYEAWVKNEETVYLVVFNPSHYDNLAEIYTEIYNMDHSKKPSHST